MGKSTRSLNIMRQKKSRKSLVLICLRISQRRVCILLRLLEIKSLLVSTARKKGNLQQRQEGCDRIRGISHRNRILTEFAIHRLSKQVWHTVDFIDISVSELFSVTL